MPKRTGVWAGTAAISISLVRESSPAVTSPRPAKRNTWTHETNILTSNLQQFQTQRLWASVAPILIRAASRVWTRVTAAQSIFLHLFSLFYTHNCSDCVLSWWPTLKTVTGHLLFRHTYGVEAAALPFFFLTIHIPTCDGDTLKPQTACWAQTHPTANLLDILLFVCSLSLLFACTGTTLDHNRWRTMLWSDDHQVFVFTQWE